MSRVGVRVGEYQLGVWRFGMLALALVASLCVGPFADAHDLIFDF